jgi:hypothetical protein
MYTSMHSSLLIHMYPTLVPSPRNMSVPGGASDPFSHAAAKKVVERT